MPFSAWRRNVRLFVAYRAGAYSLVYIALGLPFYQSLGFSYVEYAWLYGVSVATVLLFDIPTGFIADNFGYRRMLIAGVAIQASAFAVLGWLTHDKPLAWAMQVLLGIGQATARGADGPLARWSADKLGRDFYPIARWGVAAMGIGEGIASLVTAYIAATSLHAPTITMRVQAVIFALLVLVPWFMVEPREIVSHVTASPFAAIRRGITAMARNIRKELANREVRDLVLYGAVIGCTTQTVVPLVQPYFQSQHLAVWQYAAVWAGYSFLWAAFSLMAGWYERKLGRWTALASLVFWGVATNAGMALLCGWLGLGMMTGFCLIRGVQMPVVMTYLLGIVTPEHRATLLSVMTTVQFAASVMMTFVLGLVTQYISVQASFAVSAAVYGWFGLMLIARLREAHR